MKNTQKFALDLRIEIGTSPGAPRLTRAALRRFVEEAIVAQGCAMPYGPQRFASFERVKVRKATEIKEVSA